MVSDPEPVPRALLSEESPIDVLRRLLTYVVDCKPRRDGLTLLPVEPGDLAVARAMVRKHIKAARLTDMSR